MEELTREKIERVVEIAAKVASARALRRWRWACPDEVYQTCWVAALAVLPRVRPGTGEAQLCGLLQLVCARAVNKWVVREARRAARERPARQPSCGRARSSPGPVDHSEVHLDVRRVAADAGNIAAVRNLVRAYGGKLRAETVARRLAEEIS